MKTKTILFLLLVITNFSFGRQLDLCKYFTLSVFQKEIKGELNTIAFPAVNTTVQDDFGRELSKHHARYEYLLIRHFHNSSSFVELFPDSAKITKLFCTQLTEHADFSKNFALICPASFIHKKVSTTQYSSKEMMFVASRFFYCSKVNKDTAIIPKICVGINGLKEITTQRDLSALESLVYEAIFYYLENEKSPEFLDDFYQSIRKSIELRKKNLTNVDDFLLGVRNDCFNDMEQNEALKKSLLTYYQNNRNTVNFTIQ